MEGDVTTIAERPTSTITTSGTADLKKEQEKWDAWKANERLSRTEAKRRYIEKLIETMHAYASGTDEAKDLVEELEFVWDQIKSNSQHSSSERSSPLQNMERSGYLQNSSSGNGEGGVSSTAAAMDNLGVRSVGAGRNAGLRVLSPVSQADEEEARGAEEDGEEFVDAPVSQVDVLGVGNELDADGGDDPQDSSYAMISRPAQSRPTANTEARWRKRIESSLIKMTTEIAALREQLESRKLFKQRQRNTVFGWVLRLGWWAVQLVVADAVLLWIVILYMRRKKDRRLEGAVRVLLGDAVAQVHRVGREVNVKMPQLPRIGLGVKQAG